MRPWFVCCVRAFLLVASPFFDAYEKTVAVVGLLTSLGLIAGIYYLPGLRWKAVGILSVLCVLTFVALVRSQRELYRLKNESGFKVVAYHGPSSSSEILLESQPQNRLTVNVDMHFVNQSQVEMGIKRFAVVLYKRRLLKPEFLPYRGWFQWTRYTDLGNRAVGQPISVICEAISIKAKEASPIYRCLIGFSFEDPIGQLLRLKPIVRINIETTYIDEPYSLDIYPDWPLVQKKVTGSRTIKRISEREL